MIDELPLELLVHILSSLNVSDLIKFRAVSRKWRLVIDQHLLLELNVFNNEDKVRYIFSKCSRTHSDPKNSIKHDKNMENKSMVDLKKIQFLFRNARKLNIFTPLIGIIDLDMTDFISEYLLSASERI